jgi:hypothetical protein
MREELGVSQNLLKLKQGASMKKKEKEKGSHSDRGKAILDSHGYPSA